MEPPVDEHPIVATSPSRQRTSAVIAANRLMLVILRILSNEYEYSSSGIWPIPAALGHDALYKTAPPCGGRSIARAKKVPWGQRKSLRGAEARVDP